MANQELFKQAIAEAKTIREVAISNAKEVLEESITPHLKELLAARLQEMEEEDEEKDMVKEVEDDEDTDTEVDTETDAEVDDEEMEDSEAEVDSEEEMEIEDMDVEDLKNLIRDIVSQEMGGGVGDEDLGDEDMGMDADMDTMDADSEMQPADMGGEEDEEEINLDELLAELEQLSGNPVVEARKKAKTSKADDAKKKKEEEAKKKKEEDKKKKELNEALKMVNVLRRQLQETNTLNAKLLYLNKVLRANNLTESQKASLITAFDKAVNVKEVKLVYEAVKDSFNKPVNKKPITESRGFASAPQGNSTRPKVVEVDQQVLRMQKLAGIIK